MRRWLARIATWIGTGIATLWLVSRAVLDVIGYSTSPEDAEGVPAKAAAVLNWIATQPSLIAYGVPALLIGFGALTLWPHNGVEKTASSATPTASPLVIRFDPTNPGDRFWAKGMWRRGPEGHHYAVEGMEYRIELTNTGSTTVEDVEVTLSGLGNYTTDATMKFARTDAMKQTMHPGAKEMVVVFLASDGAINDPKSRVVICARGKNVPDVRAEFDFDPNAVPMLKPV